MKRLLPFLLIFASLASAEPRPLGYKPPTKEVKASLHAERAKAHGHRMAALTAASTPPAEYDLKDMGWAGDPGDQANCGSCYLYSTVKTASGAFVKAGYGKIDVFRLSFQYGMDCHDFGGCNGGNGTEVIDWMCKNGWPAESDPGQEATALYPPYVASVKTCRLPAGAKKYTPATWLFVTSDQSDKPATVAEMKAALMAYGRVNVAIDASSNPAFMTYTGGVLKTLGNAIDHEINVRGWSDSKQALLLENQWASWGGAKAPGDSCAWLAYTAVGQLQDPFVVSASTLPPPPLPTTITVPNVVGMDDNVASTTLTGAGLVPSLVGQPGRIVSSTPAAGVTVKLGSTVTIATAVVPPPPGPTQPLFTLTFNRAIKQGGMVWFTAPTAVPSGAKLFVYPPGTKLDFGDSPFEEQSSKPAPPMKPVEPPAKMPPPTMSVKRLLPLLLPGAERYVPTKYTQSIYTVAGEGGRPHIDQVPIAELDRKWHQSGGMADYPGVVSEKYRTLPAKPQSLIGDVSVKTSFGSQINQGLKREYADGTRFDDVLSYGGKVFEQRTREKQGGKWTSTVTFTDEQARPPGYHGLTQTCASCHNQAGTGSYAAGLVPGGDTVLSDPLPWALVRQEIASKPEAPKAPEAQKIAGVKKAEDDLRAALAEWQRSRRPR
jgi:hypothetical protein